MGTYYSQFYTQFYPISSASLTMKFTLMQCAILMAAFLCVDGGNDCIRPKCNQPKNDTCVMGKGSLFCSEKCSRAQYHMLRHQWRHKGFFPTLRYVTKEMIAGENQKQGRCTYYTYCRKTGEVTVTQGTKNLKSRFEREAAWKKFSKSLPKKS